MAELETPLDLQQDLSDDNEVSDDLPPIEATPSEPDGDDRVHGGK